MQKHSWKNVDWIKPVKIIIAAMRGRQRSVLRLSVNDCLEKDLELIMPNLRYYPGMCTKDQKTDILTEVASDTVRLNTPRPESCSTGITTNIPVKIVPH